MNTFTIPTPPTFRFAPNLAYLNRDPKECMHHIQNDQGSKLIPTSHGNTLIQVRESAPNTLQITLPAITSPIPTSHQQEITQYIHDWFDLDRDITPFYQLAKTDTLLHPAVQAHYGLRIISIPDLFEALIWGIIGQQINLSFAYTLKRQFVEKFGTSTTHAGITYWTFPTPATIAKLTPEDLTTIQFTTRKSEYTIGIAKLITTGELSKQALQQLPDLPAIEKSLTKIRGIGPWTANYVLMRCLRYPNAFPIDDIGLINAIKHALQMEQKPTKQEILNLAQNWSNWEAYATFYLWRTLY